MAFNSIVFLFLFLPVSVVGFHALRDSLKKPWLVFVSCAFYAWTGIQYLVGLLMVSVVNYFLGLLIGPACKKHEQRKLFLVISVLFNVGLLCLFKYTVFFSSIINSMLSSSGFHVGQLKLPLPVGISFITFSVLTYVVDVYRGKCEPQRSFIDLLVYILFFPKLIAGPIVPYHVMEPELINRNVSISASTVREGMIRFIRGLAKKVILSNIVAEFASLVFDSMTYSSSLVCWTGLFCYTLQIFYDSSGYADMAIGTAQMFGFHLVENFNYPYISKSIQEFWRRWHISLSTWFRDYIYIPLGGNRRGKGRTYLNLVIIFFLTGLWHGASWNFIVWGMFHGFFMILERLGFSRVLNRTKVLGHLYAVLIVMVGWVFFRADSLSNAVAFIRMLFCFQRGDVAILAKWIDWQMVFCMTTGVLFSTPILQIARDKIVFHFTRRPTSVAMQGLITVGRDAGYLVLFLVTVGYLVTSSYNPFIYFKF